MKIAIVVNGTRGDVQPMIAVELSKKLQHSNGIELTVELLENELKK